MPWSKCTHNQYCNLPKTEILITNQVLYSQITPISLLSTFAPFSPLLKQLKSVKREKEMDQ